MNMKGLIRMKPILTETERNGLDRAVSDAEKRTGAQIALAVVRRSDAYPELPWKAFALAASVSGLAVCAAEAFSRGWTGAVTPLAAATILLGAGALIALLAVLIPRFGRLFVASHRAETEARQYAESFFLRRELAATEGRRGVLLLVSLFERRVVLLPDKGLRSRLADEETAAIVRRMKPFLRRHDVHGALAEGLDGLTRALETAPPAGAGRTGANELPDAVIEEKGA
jgi:putative membrane protein